MRLLYVIHQFFPDCYSGTEQHCLAAAREAQRRGHDVTVGGELFSDAMGKPGTHEGTYEGMIDHNVTMITRALGGDAPARGRQGRLAGSPDS